MQQCAKRGPCTDTPRRGKLFVPDLYTDQPTPSTDTSPPPSQPAYPAHEMVEDDERIKAEKLAAAKKRVAQLQKQKKKANKKASVSETAPSTSTSTSATKEVGETEPEASPEPVKEDQQEEEQQQEALATKEKKDEPSPSSQEQA
ncbi:hypothetical protein BBP40_005796, partial [Aspergillus hancockii]